MFLQPPEPPAWQRDNFVTDTELSPCTPTTARATATATHVQLHILRESYIVFQAFARHLLGDYFYTTLL